MTRELTPAAPRKLLHTRQVHCTGWERDDGFWEVEGRLSDVRTHDFDASRGNAARKAGEPIHLMSLRITLDDRFTIVDAQAVSHQTPYEDCPKINDAYVRLIGLRVEAGFNHAVKVLFRGIGGCTHLTELLGPMATTVFQSVNPARERRRVAHNLPAFDEGIRPALLNTCFALRRGGRAAVVRWGRVGSDLEAAAPPEFPSP